MISEPGSVCRMVWDSIPHIRVSTWCPYNWAVRHRQEGRKVCCCCLLVWTTGEFWRLQCGSNSHDIPLVDIVPLRCTQSQITSVQDHPNSPLRLPARASADPPGDRLCSSNPRHGHANRPEWEHDRLWSPPRSKDYEVRLEEDCDGPATTCRVRPMHQHSQGQLRHIEARCSQNSCSSHSKCPVALCSDTLALYGHGRPTYLSGVSFIVLGEDHIFIYILTDVIRRNAEWSIML